VNSLFFEPFDTPRSEEQPHFNGWDILHLTVCG